MKYFAFAVVSCAILMCSAEEVGAQVSSTWANIKPALLTPPPGSGTPTLPSVLTTFSGDSTITNTHPTIAYDFYTELVLITYTPIGGGPPVPVPTQLATSITKVILPLEVLPGGAVPWNLSGTYTLPGGGLRRHLGLGVLYFNGVTWKLANPSTFKPFFN